MIHARKSGTGNVRRTFFDIVNWEMLLAPGVIGCRDGGMIAGWQVTGIDTETMEEVEIEAWLDQVASGLSGLGDGDALRLVRKRRKWRPRPAQQPSAGGGGGREDDMTADLATKDNPDGQMCDEPDIGASGGPDGSASGRPDGSASGGPDGLASAGVNVEALSSLFMEQEAILATSGYLWQDTITLYYHRSDGAAHGGLAASAPGGMDAFEADCRDLEDRLGGVLGLRRLGAVVMDRDGRDDAPWTSCALTGSLFGIVGLPERPVRIDPQALPMPLDRLIGIDVEQPDRHRSGRIGNRPAALMVLEGFGARKGGVQTGRLAQLQSQPQEFTWVVAYGALSANTMRKRTRRKQKFLRQGAADMGANIFTETQGKRDRYEDQAADSLEDALDQVSSGETGFGVGATWLLLTGKEGERDASIAEAVREIGSVPTAAGLGLRRETVNFVPALLSMLPGHEGLDARAFEISARTVTGLMPLRSIWQGQETCPSPLMPPATPALLRARAKTGELVNFNLHCGDLGHGLVFGPTGGGKSVLLGLLAAAFLRYRDAQVIYFDRQRSIAHACLALGGVFMEPSGDGPAGIAPLADIHELGRDWAVRWLTTLVRLQGVEPTGKMLEDLQKSVDNSWGLEKRPSINDVLSYVQFSELRTALSKFVGDGTYAQLFSQDLLFNGGFATDTEGGFAANTNGGFAANTEGGSAGVEDGDSTPVAPEEPDGVASVEPDGGDGGRPAGGTEDARDMPPARRGVPALSVFETHALMEASETVHVLSLDYIFEKVQRRFDGRPTLVVFDEAWSFFAHDLFTERIRSWLKEGRKHNVSVVMATQSLNDAIRSELTSELMESCSTKIFLPNAQAETEASAGHYRTLGLSEPEIAQIARMRSKRDYYITQPEGRRVLSFPLGHLGLSIVGRTSARDSQRALAAVRNGSGCQTPDFWPDFWKEGVNDAFDRMGATGQRRKSLRRRQNPATTQAEKATEKRREASPDTTAEKRDDASQGSAVSVDGEPAVQRTDAPGHEPETNPAIATQADPAATNREQTDAGEQPKGAQEQTTKEAAKDDQQEAAE